MCLMPDAYGCNTRKAAKDHRCYECGGVIKKGEHYHSHHGVWDGQGATYKVCLDCDELRKRIDAGVPRDDMTGFGDLRYCDDPFRDDFFRIVEKRRAQQPGEEA